MNRQVTKRRDTLMLVRTHMEKVLSHGLAHGYGPRDTAMWMASLDTRTGRYPRPDTRPEHIPKRVYRYIDAPRGCSLYWDQPLIAAAHALSRITGDDRYTRAADDYTRDYLDQCTAGNGIILWGNHYYYDAFESAAVWFKGDRDSPVPCVLDTEAGKFHEMRPIMPAWETLWRVDPRRVQRAIEVAAQRHVADHATGLFNRHADGVSGCAFPEAGGILVESISWLYNKTGDASLLPLADAVVRFSVNHCDPATKLMSTNPTQTRWDQFTCTTEVGLWAGCVLRAATPTNQPHWQDMADEALAAYLRHGYDENTGNYYGRLHLPDGKPIFGPTKTPYEPGDYVDLWRPQFPAHDYPMPLAQACLLLHQRTGKAIYEQACAHWAGVIERHLPARDGLGGYAEHYGRCLHFVLGCAAHFTDQRYRDLAQQLAAEAINVLWAQEMFRSHPGEDRCDAVDGLGYLLLALLWLHEGREPDCAGLGW